MHFIFLSFYHGQYKYRNRYTYPKDYGKNSHSQSYDMRSRDGKKRHCRYCVRGICWTHKKEGRHEPSTNPDRGYQNPNKPILI